MKHLSFLLLTVSLMLLFPSFCRAAEEETAESLPVRGLAIEAPKPAGLNRFLTFVEEELAPAHFNLLILRVDWNYAYESHPELRDPNPLTREDVEKIVAVCRKHGIRVVP